jgi:hypothetical protein
LENGIKKIFNMKNETDILIKISELELALSKEMKLDILHDINILKIQTQIDTLRWVLEK